MWKSVRFVYEEFRILEQNQMNRGQARPGRRAYCFKITTLTAMKCRIPDSSNNFGTLSLLPLNKFRLSTMVSSAVPRMASVLTKMVANGSIELDQSPMTQFSKYLPVMDRVCPIRCTR